jgi:hypothetical protein
MGGGCSDKALNLYLQGVVFEYSSCRRPSVDVSVFLSALFMLPRRMQGDISWKQVITLLSSCGIPNFIFYEINKFLLGNMLINHGYTNY